MDFFKDVRLKGVNGDSLIINTVTNFNNNNNNNNR